jgi:CRP/FNR family transcriptional regulator, cyclic AMP receptor protein
MEPGSFLDRLQGGERDALLKGGVRKRFARDAPLFLEGDRSEHVLVLLSGRVKICYADRNGREAILAVRGPGDLLGELAAIDGEPRSGAVFALEPVEVLLLAADEFRALVSTRPRLALAVLELVVGRLRDADRKRVEFGAYDSRGRVARRLVELARRFGEPGSGRVRITLRLSQDELAGWTGSSREAVAKALADFRARGWVETGRREVVVLDLDALARQAR